MRYFYHRCRLKTTMNVNSIVMFFFPLIVGRLGYIKEAFFFFFFASLCSFADFSSLFSFWHHNYSCIFFTEKKREEWGERDLKREVRSMLGEKNQWFSIFFALLWQKAKREGNNHKWRRKIEYFAMLEAKDGGIEAVNIFN